MVLKSRYPDILIRNEFTCEMLLEKLWHHGSKTALINAETGESCTFRDVYLKSYSLARFLTSSGIRREDVVLVVLPNSLEYPVIYLGAMLVGATLSTANPNYTSGELKHQLNDCEPRFLFTTEVLLPTIRQASTESAKKLLKKIIIVGSRVSSTSSADDSLAHFEDATALQPEFGLLKTPVDFNEDIALLPYSSGTTGLPKGVAISHKNLSTMLQVFIDHIENHLLKKVFGDYSSNEYELGFLPMFHVYGFHVMCLHLWRGSTHVIMPRFNFETYLQLIQQYKIRVATMVPPILIQLANSHLVEKYDVSSVNLVIVGSAPTGHEIISLLHRRLPNIRHVMQGYGMTEMTLSSHYSYVGIPVGSFGIVSANNECKVIDTKTGAELSANQQGEICVKSQSVMKGYWKNPQATKATIDSEGWLHTGDIGYYDNGENFFIVDRLKELIKVNGFQVAPAELEAVLLSHLEIQDAAVIGWTESHDVEKPMALIVRNNELLSAEAVLNFMEGKVARYKRLTGGVKFIDAIPRSASGKILRRKLREIYCKPNEF